MLNPNICKRVIAKINHVASRSGGVEMVAEYKGRILELHTKKLLQPGNRYVYLKFSILSDRYYLSSEK